jgi:hypothetical protein
VQGKTSPYSLFFFFLFFYVFLTFEKPYSSTSVGITGAGTLAAISKRVLVRFVLAIVILTFISFYPDVEAQTEVNPVFTSRQTFSTPGYNSTIRFAVNGSCTSITLKDGSWTFTGLRLGYSRNAANVSISAVDCNLTIYSVSASNFSARSVSLRYNAVGVGLQSVRFVDITQKTSSAEWSVIVPGASGNGLVWLSQGQNWDMQTDNTVVVHGVTGNITVSRYNLGAFQPTSSNQSFPFSHLIALITFGVLIAVVAVALVIKLVRKS